MTSALASTQVASSEPLTQTAPDMSFLAVSDDVTSITRVLEALHFKMPGTTTKRVVAIVKLGRNGVRFTIEEPQAFQANALLSKELFREYELDASDGEPVFGVPFDTLLDVLNIFGSAAAAQRDTALRMAYSAASSDRLLLVLTHGDGKAEVLTTCKLRTMDTDMPMSISDLMIATRLNQIILSAAVLKDAFGELDSSVSASSTVSLLLSPGEPYFQLSTGGKNGSCEVSYSKDSDVISSFAVSRHQIAHYALARLRPAIKGLGDATTASLKTNADGLLLIQMAIDVRTPHHGGSNATAKCWVDCFVVPLEDEEEMGGFGEDDSDMI